MSPKPALIILAIGCLALGAAAQSKPANVGGSWEMAMVGGPEGPGGEPPGGGDRPAMIITFVQNGEALEVSMQGGPGPEGGEVKGTGKIVGNDIEFTFTMTGGPMGDMAIVHKGKVDGDTMKGTIAMGDMGEMEWTAKRVKK
ncbi:MAG: hypothetical protein ABFD52_09160 [Acidobacteriota bacterium]